MTSQIASPVMMFRSDELERALLEARPKRPKFLEKRFLDLLPMIKQAMGRGVSQKQILEILAQHDLKLNPAKFKRLMEEARTSDQEGVKQ